MRCVGRNKEVRQSMSLRMSLREALGSLGSHIGLPFPLGLQILLRQRRRKLVLSHPIRCRVGNDDPVLEILHLPMALLQGQQQLAWIVSI